MTPRRDTASVFDRPRRDAGKSQIDDVLAEMRRQAHDSTDLASRFERLCQGVLGALSDGGGSRVFDRVDRWDDWAGRDGADGGIDLVAHRNSDRNDDAVAIQCHCYGDSRLVSERDVDAFLAKSGSASFRTRMLIHTSEGLSGHLQRQIDDSQKPCHVVDLVQMRRWKLDWWAAAEAVGAVAPPQPSPSRPAAAGRAGGADPGSTAGVLLCGAAAAIAVGVAMVFSGADIGALLIIGGIFVLVRRRGARRRQATPRPAGRPSGWRRAGAGPQRSPDGDDWIDNDLNWEDDWDSHDEQDLVDEWERVERREAERERKGRGRWIFEERDPTERNWRDRDDRWDLDDDWDSHDDGWDWDDEEPPRRSAMRGRSRRSWDADEDDYI